MTEIIYTPGVCNIGPEEIARRRMVGWVGTVCTIVVAAVLLVLPISFWWRLVVFVPAFVAAAGFIQAQFHFCVGFAKTGVYNFDTLGKTETIIDPTAKSKDSNRATELYLYTIIIALFVTAIILFL